MTQEKHYNPQNADYMYDMFVETHSVRRNLIKTMVRMHEEQILHRKRDTLDDFKDAIESIIDPKIHRINEKIPYESFGSVQGARYVISERVFKDDSQMQHDMSDIRMQFNEHTVLGIVLRNIDTGLMRMVFGAITSVALPGTSVWYMKVNYYADVDASQRSRKLYPSYSTMNVMDVGRYQLIQSAYTHGSNMYVNSRSEEETKRYQMLPHKMKVFEYTLRTGDVP